jgi:putative MATE family efflux protein
MRPPAILRRDPHDREILRLAVPVFGALVAEPLYVLVDTAIVGRLGTAPLAGLAIAGTVLTAVFQVFNFLAYGTTAAVARRFGAGDPKAAAEHGIAGIWLGIGLGLVLTIVGLVAAPAVVDAMGASARVRPDALVYLRVGLLGAPFMLCTLAATGYLRGLQDTKTPLFIAIGANVVNLALEIVLVYGFDTGIAGSAWGTVVAQILAAIAMLVVVGRTVRQAGASARPRADYVRNAAIVGSQLTIRTASLLAVVIATTAIASRISDTAVAAHQIAYQLWYFLALSLDAIAIAGQAIVGRYLGADDTGGARQSSRRMIEWGIVWGTAAAIGVLVLQPVLVHVFTGDHAVRDELLGVLWAVALMQPLAAVVFVLDGILIGAGESRYLALAMFAAMLAFVPAAVLVVVTDSGLLALWGAVWVFVGARWIGMMYRYRTDAWLIPGAEHPTA